MVGFGASEKQSLPPENCTIANNLLVGQTYPLIEQLAEPRDTDWTGNVFQGAELGVASRQGFRQADLVKHLDADGVFRFQQLSGGSEAFAFVTVDIDGQTRAGRPHVGCDQISEAPVARRPLTAADVGPDWFRSGR